MRIAIFPDWNGSPFAFVEQMQVYQALKAILPNTQFVGAAEFEAHSPDAHTGPLLSYNARLNNTLGIRLNELFPIEGLEWRAARLDKRSRVNSDLRYRRISHSDLTSSPEDDIGRTTDFLIPRDGAVDFNDCDGWASMDRPAEQIYAVKPTWVTWHSIADTLTPCSTPSQSLLKRRTLYDATRILCEQDDEALLAKRYGIPDERIVGISSEDFGVPEYDAGLLVLADTEDDVVVAQQTINSLPMLRQLWHKQLTIALNPPSSLYNTPLRYWRPVQGGLGSGWEEIREADALGGAIKLLSMVDRIAVLGTIPPLAFAIARWVSSGRSVTLANTGKISLHRSGNGKLSCHPKTDISKVISAASGLL